MSIHSDFRKERAAFIEILKKHMLGRMQHYQKYYEEISLICGNKSEVQK
jgi:hypothetical protein